jgi:hypothetical protein
MCPNCGAFHGAFVDSRSLDAVKFCKSCKSTNQVGKNECFECGKSDFVSRLSDVEISATAKVKKQANVKLSPLIGMQRRQPILHIKPQSPHLVLGQ